MKALTLIAATTVCLSLTQAPPSLATPGFQECGAVNAPNFAAPEFYRQQYDPSTAKLLQKDVAAYRSAVSSADNAQIGQSAGTLYSEVLSDAGMAKSGVFGCYNPAVLQALDSAANDVAPVFDNLSSAAVGCCGHSPGEVAGLISQADPKLRNFIAALNTYASQFGGMQVS